MIWAHLNPLAAAKGGQSMRSFAQSTLSKWFLIGFGTRALFGIVVFLMALRNFEAQMLLLADLPTMIVLALAEGFLPSAIFTILTGGDPLYIPMNLLGCVLWSGIFMLFPLTRNIVVAMRRRHRKPTQSVA